MEHIEPLTPQARIACDFAAALVRGDYRAAHELLTTDLQQRLSPDALIDQLNGMFVGYAAGRPKYIWFEEAQHALTESWPGKSPDEVCWAYVGIEGDDFNEGVAVLVVSLDGQFRIREIVWGRP